MRITQNNSAQLYEYKGFTLPSITFTLVFQYDSYLLVTGHIATGIGYSEFPIPQDWPIYSLMDLLVYAYKIYSITNSNRSLVYDHDIGNFDQWIILVVRAL